MPTDFVASLGKAVIEENASIYRQLFTETSLTKVSDPYWKRALTLFNSLSLEQREVFFEVIRQVTVDTAANVLGVIDGVNTLDGIEEEFLLTDGGNTKLNGDLQSLFLLSEEKTQKFWRNP